MTRARLQHEDATRRGFKPYEHASVYSHLYGVASEIAVARLLGVSMPEDWTWEGDKKRGGDLVLADGRKVHVRSSRKGDNFLWRPDKDYRDGVWLFVDTSGYPVVSIVGWLKGEHAALLGTYGYIPRDCLMDMSSLKLASTI